MADTREIDARLLKLQSLAANNVPVGMRRNAEKLYGEAYQRLVRDGAARPIRRKYRCYG